MNGTLHFSEHSELEERTLQQLTQLLITVVEDGASIGFLPPLREEEAREYWLGAVEPGVLLWTAWKGDTLCGTVQLQLCTKANGIHRAEVAKLMVHPEERKQGIARALMNRLEARAKQEGRSLLVLDTRTGDPSNQLYLSLGYLIVGTIPAYAVSASGDKDSTTLYYKELRI